MKSKKPTPASSISEVRKRMLFLSESNFGPGVVGKLGERYKLYRQMEGCISLYLLRCAKNVGLRSLHSSGSKISRMDIRSNKSPGISTQCSLILMNSDSGELFGVLQSLAKCQADDEIGDPVRSLSGKLYHQDCVSDTEFVKDAGQGVNGMRVLGTVVEVGKYVLAIPCIRRTYQGMPVCVKSRMSGVLSAKEQGLYQVPG